MMAETKMYVKQGRKNGKILISQSVIATIVANALKEVDGVAGISAKPSSDIAEVVGKKTNAKGLNIVIGEQDELYVDCNINIFYGQSIVTVAQATQEAVTNALQATAGLTVAAVNVNVCGILRQH